MAMTIRKIVPGAVVLAAVGGVAWLALRPVPVPVDLVEVRRASLEVTVNAEGVTRIRDLYEVSAPVAGMVLRSPVAVGAEVVEGETLVALIEPGEPAFLDARSRLQAEAAVREAEAALQLALANVSRARTELALAEAQRERFERLFTRGGVPEADIERIRLDTVGREAALAAARAEVALRESTLERQRAMLVGPGGGSDGQAVSECCIRLTAPVTGQVLELLNPSRRMVPAGAPLLTIGTRDDLEVAVELLSSDAVRLTAGADARIERWGGEGVLAARLREIEPAAFTRVSALGIEEQRVRAVLDFEDGPQTRPGLGHAFRVFVRIVEWQGENELVVPVSALFRDRGGWAVFVANGGRAELRHVEIGRRTPDLAQVLSGLSSGEKVITHPSDRVAQGGHVVGRDRLDR